jgi:hypothetical protein
MVNPRNAAWYRTTYRDISGALALTAATGDTTLVSNASANGLGTGWTLFIQRIIVWVSTDAAQSMSFEDDNGTPRQIAEVTTSPGDSTRWDFDYGDRGVPLTEAKDFELNVSAAGLAGMIVWEGYARRTAAGAP